MEHVGVGLRAVATIIDTGLLFVAGYLIALATGGITATGFHLQGAPFALWLIIALAYYIVMEARSGATIGKRLIGLKVVRLEGGAPLTWQSSIVRNVLRLVHKQLGRPHRGPASLDAVEPAETAAVPAAALPSARIRS